MEIISSHPLFAYLFIYFARVIDVSLDVFRVLLLTRGYSIPAAAIGFVEVSVFVLALGTVFAGGHLDLFKVVAYAGGFATGNLLGIRIEQKMAIGYTVVQIFPEKENCTKLRNLLREHNYGVTCIPGEGKWGPREILVVTIKRKDLPDIIKIMDQVAPETFFNTSDIRSIHGGIFPHPRRRAM
ncbi:DUF2179 domain-containing protein [Candidatus Formimonas warabiya]|uniref:UPF0316 protein DCMF_15805 n=1 Tax=Formimonas warabiya TaxID=1761012 RepID=A0A3G1KU58_FORW1|nr:DUF5698 domain-containing protein [Candidatus Formimonas warabiya]ATW26043.1 hypothetical protein DCMF_15805 [Candidatus Formimonas warabiya]